MIKNIVLICSLGASVISAEQKIKKFGKHDFPEFTRHGLPTANEFQMIEPENFKDGRLKSSGEYTIESISPTLIVNDEEVTVTFSSSNPDQYDWIAAYSPADIDITTTSPIKYGWCDDSDDYLTTGKGSLNFNLTNLRSDIAFYYLSGGYSHTVIQEQSSETVSFKDINEQLRPRIVPTGDYNQIKLLWSSATSTEPLLRWGTEPGKYTNTVQASTFSIPKTDLCGAPANSYGWREMGLVHTAIFEGMRELSMQKIYYQFGDAETDNYSEEFTFFVPPLPGVQSSIRPTRAILYDDLGRGSTDDTYTWNEYGRPSIYTLNAVGAEVEAGEVDVIYHGGDISYATGYTAVWDFFLDMISPAARSVPYLTTVGNHESDYYNTASVYNNSDSGGECGVIATRMIPMPSPATTDEPWWSYDVGLMHFVGMSTEHDYSIGSKQYNWLKNDLENVDRTVTPWVIFGGHRAMYLNSDYGGNPAADIDVMDYMIENLEPLLWENRVNLGFYGHNHVVQRQAAVLKKQVIQASVKTLNDDGHIVHYHDDPQATVHMVVGTGGAGFTKNAVDPKPEWNEMYMYEWGYARLTAVNATYLEWEWVKSETGEILDRMVITQGDATKPWKLD